MMKRYVNKNTNDRRADLNLSFIFLRLMYVKPILKIILSGDDKVKYFPVHIISKEVYSNFLLDYFQIGSLYI